MGNFIDRTGMRYGQVIVISRAENIGAKVAWLCKCDCGNEFIRRGDGLNEKTRCPDCDSKYRKGIITNENHNLHSGIKNEIGNKYNKLTVIELDTSEEALKKKGAQWICQCDCGNYISVSGRQLRSNSVKSCGCLHKKEEKIGTKFGKLTIIKRIENSNAGKIRYECQCDCGNICQVVGSDLRSGQQISCGCIKSKGEYNIIQLLNKNNIQYKKEITFKNCKDINLLPFDFGIYKNDELFYLIEYDGKQHFSAAQAWSDFSFNKTQLHDQIKNQWCKENNIPLIRIPYTRLDNLCIEDLLLETSEFIVKE